VRIRSITVRARDAKLAVLLSFFIRP